MDSEEKSNKDRLICYFEPDLGTYNTPKEPDPMRLYSPRDAFKHKPKNDEERMVYEKQQMKHFSQLGIATLKSKKSLSNLDRRKNPPSKALKVD